jgi:hypothetical protein
MERTFGIIPAASSSYVFIWVFSVIIFLILVGVIAMYFMFSYQAKNARFTVSDQGLSIGPGLYGRFIPKEQIDTAGVREVNLNVKQAYQPRWRTNGASLPGFAAGWFKLENKEKALLFVTDRSRVVYIPTTANYAVMLSVREAGEFVELLQSWK